MKNLLLPFLLFLFSSSLFSQSSAHKSYDIPTGSDDYGNKIITAYQSAFIAGSTNKVGAGNYDAMLMRLDTAGHVVWQTQLGGAQFDAGRSITTFHDGIILTGGTHSLSASNDIQVSLIDTSGGYQGSAAYGFDSTNETSSDVVSLGDTSLLIIGTTDANNSGGKTNMVIIRTDHDAGPVWIRTYGTTSGSTIGTRVFAMPGIGFLALGTSSNGSQGDDAYVVHFDEAGHIVDQILIGAAGHDEGWFFTFDGAHIIIGGLSGSTSGPNRSNIFITELQPTMSGIQTLWTKTYGGDVYSELRSLDIDPTDGNIVASGDMDVSGAGSEGIVFKVDTADGSLIWATSFGSPGDDYMEGATILPDASTLVVGGTNETPTGTTSNVFVAKLNQAGNLCDGNALALVVRDLADSVTFDNSPDHIDSAVAFVFQNGALFTSNSYTPIENEYCSSTGVRALSAKDNNIQIYPNPTSGRLFIESAYGWSNNVKMNIYNAIGSEVYTKTIVAGTKDFSIDLSSSPKGMYIITFNDGNSITTKKISLN